MTTTPDAPLKRIVRSVSLYPHEHAALRWLANHFQVSLSEMMRRLIAQSIAYETESHDWRALFAPETDQ